MTTSALVKILQSALNYRFLPRIGPHTLSWSDPELLSHRLTDPQMVYVLRWIAGRHAAVPEFDPSAEDVQLHLVLHTEVSKWLLRFQTEMNLRKIG